MLQNIQFNKFIVAITLFITFICFQTPIRAQELTYAKDTLATMYITLSASFTKESPSGCSSNNAAGSFGYQGGGTIALIGASLQLVLSTIKTNKTMAINTIQTAP